MTVLGSNDSCAGYPPKVGGARPPFALERLEATGYGATAGERIVYRLPHPAPDGSTTLSLTPLEFLERLALLIAPPRIHRHRYHGVLAPNANLRYQVIALGREQDSVEESISGQLDTQSAVGSSGGATPGRRTSSRWDALIARIYDVLPLVCPSCGASMRIIAFITDPVPVRSILTCLDLPSRPPLLSPARGAGFEISNLSPSNVARFVTDRRSGALAPQLRGRESAGVRAGTIDGDFRWLRSVFNFARHHKVDGGRRLLPVDPLDDLPAWPKEKNSPWPKEKNKRKPVASEERYTRTQEHTDTVDPNGRLRCILALARFTGRRESAICGLRVNDVLRDNAAVAKELAGAGMDERIAGHMPHGAIRWSDETDKEGFLFIAPLSEQAREEIDRYLRKNPRVGDVPLFPAARNGLKAIRRDVAARWLIKAEEKAKLPKLKRGVYHPYRRLWASERKALPSKDVATPAAGKTSRQCSAAMSSPTPPQSFGWSKTAPNGAQTAHTAKT